MTNISRQPTPYKARKSVVSGFTLIELLVVMVIISIIITATLLSMHRLMQNRQAVTVAKQLAQVIPAAQQEAILQLAPFGLKISEHRYQFYRFDIKANSTNGSWHLLKQDRVLANKTLSSKIFLSLKTQAETAEKNQQTPQIIFSPSGDITAFELNIGTNATAAIFSLMGKSNGDVILNTPK